MRVFISWSKPAAKSVAIELKHCIEMCLGSTGVDAWMSELDIPKGSRWSHAVAENLEKTDVGIICVTPENVREPWLYFEAGALSKSVQDSQVHPLVIGMPPSALSGPLALFQATTFSFDNVLSLLISIAKSKGEPVNEAAIRERFSRVWTPLETAGKLAAASPQQKAEDPVESGLSAESTEVLQFIALSRALDEDPTALDISRQLNRNRVRVEHHLDLLMKMDLIDAHYFAGGAHEYYLTEKGRAVAVKEGWV
ncbi:hypothetical protein BSFA1_11150 [Burkholderia sp. SFA1]|nr:hypothetical protein BSFA1_11150 [Burkholderia sp. SFA1]